MCFSRLLRIKLLSLLIVLVGLLSVTWAWEPPADSLPSPASTILSPWNLREGGGGTEPEPEEMTITRLGTTSYYNYADSGSTTINVPVGTTAVLLCIVWYINTSGYGMDGGGTASLGGVSFSLVVEGDYADWSSNAGGVSVMLAQNASFPTGNQTFAWNWAGSSDREEGAEFMFVFLSGVDSVRDSDIDYDNGTRSITLTTQTGDMVYGCVYSFDTTDADAAPSGSGQTEIVDTAKNNLCQGAVGEEAGGSGSTVFTYNGSYSSCAAVALIPAAGGTSTVPPLSMYHRRHLGG